MKMIEAPLIESFVLLNDFFQRHKIRYCLIGGIAAGFWGEPRYTRDMDFTVVSQTRSLDSIIQALKKEKFTVESKGPSQVQVIKKDKLQFLADLTLAEIDYQDWVVQRAINVEIFDIKVPICTAEDLMILKLIANRRQDLLDIENVLKKRSHQLDKKYLKEWFSFWELNERFDKEFGKDFPDIL